MRYSPGVFSFAATPISAPRTLRGMSTTAEQSSHVSPALSRSDCVITVSATEVPQRRCRFFDAKACARSSDTVFESNRSRAICAVSSPVAELAMKQLEKLRGCEAHSTVILSSVDDATFRKLGVNLTSEAKYQTKKLYHKK